MTDCLQLAGRCRRAAQAQRSRGSADSFIEMRVPPKQKQRFAASVSVEHCSCRGSVSLLI